MPNLHEVINVVDVYAAITDELKYQEERWGPDSETKEAWSGGDAFDRSLDEYSLYIYRYAQRLGAENCHTTEDFDNKLHTVRKIAALCVACMSEHGPLSRAEEQAA